MLSSTSPNSMACNSLLNSPFLPSLPLHHRPIFQNPKTSFRISCNVAKDHRKLNDDEKKSQFKRISLNTLRLSATLTVLSASLPQHSSAAAPISRKKRLEKKNEALTHGELQNWAKGLPVVSNRLPYSEILDLKRENKLKHVIKPPNSVLKQRSVVVLAVLEDNKVVRIVLPSSRTDPLFWEEWGNLQIDGLCVNAYSPPLKRVEVPKPYLGFLSKLWVWMVKLIPKPKSKKALMWKRARDELKKRTNEELEKVREEREMMRKEREMMEKAIKMEERRKRREMKRAKYEQSLQLAQERSQEMSSMYSRLADSDSSGVSYALAVVFFYLFYHFVVLNYIKQKKDYEDRLKMKKAEDEEERKKMVEWEGSDGLESGLKRFMESGARVRRARNKGPPQYLERGVDIKFSDVAGIGKIRDELEEIPKFFTHAEMYQRRGLKIPSGILLCGPPGVGKTLLAKAVAGETGVNFFSVAASQFVEMFAGLGASRIRSLYQEAKENAPSIIYIDELDSIGSVRGLIKGSGGQERDASLNQLLVCLDGFEGRGNVITLASTNMPEMLDPALVRPGRFDRKIYIPKPGLLGRIEILKVHACKKQMAPDIDFADVAAMTDGMVGAELANIIEVAAIRMMREGRSEITTDDLIQAAQTEVQGMVYKTERSPELWRQVALNEAAMAVAAANFPDHKNIQFITIDPRGGRELGYTRVKMDGVAFKGGLLTRRSLLDHICVQLAPRAADELWHGKDQLSTIWAETADNARSAARALVRGGLSEKHYGMNNFWTQDGMNELDSEPLRILDECYERTKGILERNRELVDAVVDSLLEKKSLTRAEFFNLVELHGCLEPMPPSILDIRKARRSGSSNVVV